MTQIDASSFDRFSVVAFAPATIREEVERLRRLLPPSGRPILAAHVTVKGTFVEPRNLDQIAEEIATCCLTASPFSLVTEEAEGIVGDEDAGILLRVREEPALTALHRHLVAALRDHCVTIYGGEAEGRFRPHLTLAQQFPAAALSRVLEIVQRHQPQYSFAVEEISLVGRHGGHVWEELVTFPLLGNLSAT